MAVVTGMSLITDRYATPPPQAIGTNVAVITVLLVALLIAALVLAALSVAVKLFIVPFSGWSEARLFAQTYRTPARTTVIATIRMVAMTGLTACSFFISFFMFMSSITPSGGGPAMRLIGIKVPTV